MPSGKRMFQQLWTARTASKSDADDSPPDAEPPTQHVEPTPEESATPRRSLWEVMRGVASAGHSADTIDSTPELPTDSVASDAPKPKGLWSVMSGIAASQAETTAEGEASAVTEEPRDAVESLSCDAIADDLSRDEDAAMASLPIAPEPELSAEKKYEQAAALATMSHIKSTWEPEPPVEPFDEDEREWSSRAIAAASGAALTVALAALSYLPEWWYRLPPLVAGLLSVLLGFIAAGDVRRSRGRLKGRWAALCGVWIGGLGMFLAPTVFARWGEHDRENFGREEIEGRLTRIGKGLNLFHDQEGHFPEAAIRGRDIHGNLVPMHGWMTSLLPALGHDAIYRKIDLKQPFDAAVNVGAMQQPIPEFTLPKRKPSRSPRGFGLTHFAGVGGQDVREPTGLVHLGMFSDGGPVRQADFTDGLSQTIIVGEIRDAPPAWGEPGNVRSIGTGLNRQFRGFGNENGSGATFLHADGSVKFYSTKTDLRVLQRLETRDGAEPE
jgi:hypothetical protein